ncbi:MAG: hypothetical protein H0W70_15700 [Actinobacteria bacterium]|nr:hypothetical protein [Actinomycetota bacterium]
MPDSSGSRRAGNAVQAIESCNSTWLFDAERMRFRRVPKGTSIDVPAPPEEWEPYFSLDLADDSGAFVVALNQAGTRLLRSYRHGVPCPHCDANATSELSLEAVKLGYDIDGTDDT